MIPALVVFCYLGVVLYIGVFAFRHAAPGEARAEDYFLAGRSLGPAVFLLSQASAYTTGASLQVDGGMIRSTL